ncbi:hypothetical protein [Rickettsia endosymbiont of Orchestes rusci]|uniref:hypothetical protein n=1 Tax=Rickettsia endosymbiont of Orchestes rusci TaxID=3066250 RepID=UPI00313CDC60
MLSSLAEVLSKIRNRLEVHKDSDKQFIAILQLINKHGLARVTNACSLTIATGGCSAKLVEQYLYPSNEFNTDESEFIQLKAPPDADCSIYSKLYLTGGENK